eukprot:365243-Chlamydomonas_euryale.AAC.20
MPLVRAAHARAQRTPRPVGGRDGSKGRRGEQCTGGRATSPQSPRKHAPSTCPHLVGGPLGEQRPFQAPGLLPRVEPQCRG